MSRTRRAYPAQVDVTPPPGVRTATCCGYRATVAWNASHIVAAEPTSAIATSSSLSPPRRVDAHLRYPAADGHQRPDRFRAVAPCSQAPLGKLGRPKITGPVSAGPDPRASPSSGIFAVLAQRERCQLHSGGDAELGVGVFEVRFDGVTRDEQAARDGRVGQSFGGQQGGDAL